MSDLEYNKKLVTDFIHLAFNDRQTREAAQRYLSPDYVQHNPTVKPGRDGLVETMEKAFQSTPQVDHLIKRVVAENDLVVVHSLIKFAPDDRGTACIDILRVEGERIAEHWGVLEPVPADPPYEVDMV